MSVRNQSKFNLHHYLFMRPVRNTLYRLKHLTLPGCKGVPVWEVMRFFFSGIANGVLWQRAKGLSYSFLMAIPPLLIFLFTLIAYFPVDGLQNEFLHQLHDFIPSNFYDRVAQTINDVMGHRHSSLLSIGFIVSVILAANGMHGLLMSFNYANNSIERRPFIKRYAICLMLVFLLFGLIVVVLLLWVGYKYLIIYLIRSGILTHTPFNVFIVSTGRWIILTLLTLLVISTIYYWAPAKKQRVGYFSVGSVIATLLFFGLSWLFQIYINNFNNFNILYGSIGTLLVIMLWIFFNCLVVLVGYELNISVLNGKLFQEKLHKMQSSLSAHGMTELQCNNRKKHIQS